MSLLLESLQRTQWREGFDPDTHHFVCCCDEDTAMCGEDVTELPWVDDLTDVDVCVVCDDLWADDSPCPRCGCVTCA